MGAYQLEWKRLLSEHESFADWSVRASGGDLLIRVPEDTDMDVLRLQFADVISPVAPLVRSAPATLKFYVGNSDESNFIFTLN